MESLPHKVGSQASMGKQCVLHNFLQGQMTPAQVASLLQEAATVDMGGIHDLTRFGNRAARDAMLVRQNFMDFFVNVLPLSWHDTHVNRGIFTE